MENFRSKYATIKRSIRVNRDKKMVSDLKVTNCLTGCETCVTSACVECVINGSGNACGLTSLVSAPCRPKADVGEQMFKEDFSKMEVQWND
jgi:hypothetical protein